MLDSISPPNYDMLKVLFAKAQVVLLPAEVHGLVCGFICAGTRLNGKLCLDMLMLNDQSASPEVVEAMRCAILKLYALSYEQVSGDGFGFQLVLPSDEAIFQERASAIGEFCQGFLTGLGMAGVQLGDSKAEETREVLEQLAEIASLEYDVVEVGEEEETSLMHVTEFVRMAVYMIFTDLALRQTPHTLAGSDAIH